MFSHGRLRRAGADRDGGGDGFDSAEALRAGSRAASGRCRPRTSGCPGLLGAAALTDTFFVWRIYAPDAQAVIVATFWIGLTATAALVALPRPRVSVAANVLIALGSVFLVLRSSASPRAADAVTIASPSGKWQVVNGGRSTLVNATDAGRERNAIDFVQLVDGKTYQGDRAAWNTSNLRRPAARVADGRVTRRSTPPGLPVGGTHA